MLQHVRQVLAQQQLPQPVVLLEGSGQLGVCILKASGREGRGGNSTEESNEATGGEWCNRKSCSCTECLNWAYLDQLKVALLLGQRRYSLQHKQQALHKRRSAGGRGSGGSGRRSRPGWLQLRRGLLQQPMQRRWQVDGLYGGRGAAGRSGGAPVRRLRPYGVIREDIDCDRA